jgi:hypothetical protein
MAIWNILQTFGMFYVHLVDFLFIWYIFCSFGTFFSVLVSCSKKNLAALDSAIAVCLNVLNESRSLAGEIRNNVQCSGQLKGRAYQQNFGRTKDFQKSFGSDQQFSSKLFSQLENQGCQMV